MEAERTGIAENVRNVGNVGKIEKERIKHRNKQILYLWRDFP